MYIFRTYSIYLFFLFSCLPHCAVTNEFPWWRINKVLSYLIILQSISKLKLWCFQTHLQGRIRTTSLSWYASIHTAQWLKSGSVSYNNTDTQQVEENTLTSTASLWKTNFPFVSWVWAAVAEGVEWSSSNLKVGSSIFPKRKICMPKCPWARCWTPELCLIEQQSPANSCTVWM